MTQDNIPIYAHLYGEIESPGPLDALHSERLEQRSAFHDWKIKPHRHDQLEQIFAVLKGGGEATIDGKRITFNAPFIIYVPSLAVHSFRYLADSSGYVLSAFKDEVSACLKEVPTLTPVFQQALTASHADNNTNLETALNQVSQFHEEYRGNNPGRLLALRSLLSLILVRLSRCVPIQGNGVYAENNPEQRLITELIELIEEHYSKNHSTEFYAAALNLTSSKLRQVTHSILGISAHQLINNKILLEAKRNILYTSMTASQIAHMLGFKDPAYFSRFFKKHTDESPSEYRKRALITAEFKSDR